MRKTLDHDMVHHAAVSKPDEVWLRMTNLRSLVRLRLTQELEAKARKP